MASSCASDPIVDAESEGVELSFATYGSTRASVTTDIATVGSRFAVFGDMTKVEPGSSDSPEMIFHNTAVTYDGAKWNYSGTRYWFPDFEYSFAAIHPASFLSDANGGFKYSNSTLSFSYTMPQAAGNRVKRDQLTDILAATHRRVYDDDGMFAPPPVRLNFFHALARINFLLKYEGRNDKVTVTGVEFEGVGKTATFSIVPAPLSAGGVQTDDYTLSWNGHSDKGTLIADTDMDVMNGETRQLFPDGDALLMIPQPENNGIIMKISYVYDHGGVPEELTLTSQDPVGGWEAGKVYSYSIPLSEKDASMNFDVNVTDWKKGASTDVPVPHK